MGITNGSQVVANVLSSTGLVLDIAAEVTDVLATTIVTTAIVEGATAGAAITLPGGGTTVVGGGAGATVGWAIGELGVRGWVTAGNVLATGATLLSTTSDVISGKTEYSVSVNGSSEGVEYDSKLKIGSSTQVGTLTTIGGWTAPLTYPSLAFQTVAITGDLGIFTPPPINIETKSSVSFKERKLNYRINIYQEK